MHKEEALLVISTLFAISKELTNNELKCKVCLLHFFLQTDRLH